MTTTELRLGAGKVREVGELVLLTKSPLDVASQQCPPSTPGPPKMSSLSKGSSAGSMGSSILGGTKAPRRANWVESGPLFGPFSVSSFS